MIRVRSKLVGGIAGAWLLASVAAGGQAIDPPPSLRFALDSRVEWITPVLVRVHYELTNVTSAPLYVAQVPGPAASVSCRTASGGIGGSAGGAWSHDGTLARKYYIQIASGEARYHQVVRCRPRAWPTFRSWLCSRPKTARRGVSHWRGARVSSPNR